MQRRYNNRGRDQINIEKVEQVLLQERDPPSRPREELLLLQAVEDEVVSRLDQSLHHAVLINLAKETQPEQVTRPWERELRIGLKPATPIPAEQTIAQIFDNPAIQGKLLILGQPGAGKTTALLELAKALVERAQDDINHQIPIILSLSTWKDEKQLIKEWMVAELKSKYGVSIKLGCQWVSDRKILPLLDGLDEVASERQGSCVTRINEFLSPESSPRYVAVCSRLEEYENLTHRLQLNGAICLKALEDEQIQAYLTQLERPLLWQMFSNNPDLLELVRAPLLLSITLLTYPQDSNNQWQQWPNATDPMQFLLDAYIERMLCRQIEIQAYDKRRIPRVRKTRYWLIWLAQQMQMRSQTEFLIEEMQPSTLSVRQRRLYRLLLTLIGWLLVILLWGICHALNLRYENMPLVAIYPSDLGLSYALGLSCIALLSLAPGLDSITPIEFIKVKFNTSLAIPFIGAGVLLFLLNDLSILLLEKDGLQLIFNRLPLFLAYGLCYVLFFGLISSLSGGAVTVKVSANQGIKRSVKTAWNALLSVILATQSMTLLGVAIFSGRSELFFALIFGIKFGGLACIQHFTLRLILYQSKKAPWNYAKFLDYCTERLLLQRVGGRYRFIHKYLQDHFANMPLEQPKN